MVDCERFRLSSLGDLCEMLVDGWEIAHMHYADSCGTDERPDPRAAAFIELRRPDAESVGLYIPDDERQFSHRGLLAVFRNSPRIWKHRSARTVQERLAAAQAEEDASAVPTPWDLVMDPADRSLYVEPADLVGVVALGQVETIDGITVAVLSLERYRDFSRIRYLAHAADVVRRGSLAALDVLAVDDRGRRYRSASLGVERAGSRLEGVIALTPGIPRDVTGLTFTVGSIGASGPDGHLGPWVFPVVLPTPGVG